MTVLESQALCVVRAYGITCAILSDEEIAAEMVSAILSHDEEDWTVGEPVWLGLLNERGVCMNCLCTDCGCCIGCGGVDADTDPPGTHGHHCGF